MALRKLHSQPLFNGKEFIYDTTLVIDEKGIIQGLEPFSAGSAGTEIFDGILCPGFINAHCHLELSHMKGRIPERTGLVDFVWEVVKNRNAAAGTIPEAIAAAEKQMIASGIVAVGDISNNDSTIPKKSEANLHYYNFIEASGWQPGLAETRFERILDVYQKFCEQLPGQEHAIVPHAAYSVSPELWEMIRPYYKGKLCSIHNQESPAENEFFINGQGDLLRMFGLMNIDNGHHQPKGQSSIRSYFERMLEAGTILLVHNCCISQEDIDYIASVTDIGKVYFCICINANLYIEGNLPPIELLVKNDLNIVLGTDSLASNHQLSIMEEISTILHHFPSIKMEQALRWACYNGAAALGFGNSLGSFAPGKKPGVMLLNEKEIRRLVSH